MVQLHPGLLDAQVRQLAERHGLNPRGCRFDTGLGHLAAQCVVANIDNGE